MNPKPSLHFTSMKTPTSLNAIDSTVPNCRSHRRRQLFGWRCGPMLLVLLGAAWQAFAASQTWTNAPAGATWANTNNWVARAVPGGINLTGTTLNNDVATFNSPLAGGIGGAGNPILIDDATVNNARSRQIGGITFDSINCGAYVITSLSAPILPTAGNPETGILNVSHNGVNSITINGQVTNSQVVLIPLRVRLPNSTPGLYSLVNNATTPSANLIIASITHDGANTRATTFTLGGTNTGNNIVT